MAEGIKTLPQPPWYVGYNNQTVPPDNNPMTAAARYGFRGSKNIHQHNVPAVALPVDTLTEHMPRFIQQQTKNQDFVDEYVPPILATKFNTINGMETPKLWPENTEYVTGYRKKHLPTLWKYKRETTVCLPERPPSPKPLSMMHSKSVEQTALLTDYARMESKKSFLSLPMTSQLKFETEWNDVVKEEASRPLKHSLRRAESAGTFTSSGGLGNTKGGAGGVTREEHGLLDPSDTMRYTGSAAMIVHTKSTDELKFRLRMEKTKAKVHTPFTLKWQHVIGHFENINHQLKKHQTMTDAIEKIAVALQQTAINNGSQTSLKRIEFLQAAVLMTYFEGISEKQLSQLYSIFDPMKKNSMRVIDFILTLLILDSPEALPIPKLQTLWQYITRFGLDRNILDLAFDVLSVCAGSYDDLQRMERLFRHEFRPKCYEFAVHEKKAADEAAEVTRDLQNMLNIYDTHKGPTVTSPTILSQPSSPKPLSPRSNVSGPKGKNTLSPTAATSANDTASGAVTSSYIQHQYNICEHYLNTQTFGLVLEECPEIVAAFDQQLSAKLKLCYGRDDRYKKPEEEFVPTENLDFTWIIKKAPLVKASFGLFEQQEGTD